MKRFVLALLPVCLALCLYGCSVERPTVTFFYPRTEVQYDSGECVLVSEARDSMSPSDSLSYLLSFYLEGPISGDLILPVPTGTRVLQIIPGDAGLTLVMSREFASLDGIDLTIACSSIATTCFGLTDAPQITFAVSEISNTVCIITRNSLTLTDTVITDPNSTEPTN